MTTYNKTTLKTFFETADIPTGTDFANFIDSCVNLAETAEQTMLGALNPTELVTARVSAGTGVFTGTMTITGNTSVAGNVIIDGTTSAKNIFASAASFIGTVSANKLFSDTINASGASFTGLSATTVSAQSINVSTDVSAATGTVYASAVRSTNGVLSSTGIVSAAGTTQGAAAVLTNIINRGKGIADGSTTGFTPLANRAGLVQYLFNEGPSANLWPPTGGTINGLAANAAFALAASASYTIFHISASSYGVK